jgi:hypothetical protein
LGSLVFSRSKDGGAGDRPLPEHSTNQNLFAYMDCKIIIINKHKCLSVVTERCILSNEQFVAVNARKVVTIFTSSKRVSYNLKSGYT